MSKVDTVNHDIVVCWGRVALCEEDLGDFNGHPKHAHYPVAACCQLAPGTGIRKLSSSVMTHASCSKLSGTKNSLNLRW